MHSSTYSQTGARSNWPWKSKRLTWRLDEAVLLTSIRPWFFKALSHYIDTSLRSDSNDSPRTKSTLPQVGVKSLQEAGMTDAVYDSIIPLLRRRSFPELFIILQDSLPISPRLLDFSASLTRPQRCGSNRCRTWHTTRLST